MKTAIKTLFAVTLTAVVLTSSAFTSFAKEGDKSLSSLVSSSSYTMIQTNGNVRLHLKQGNKESIRIETAIEGDQVSVTQTGQKLKISSNTITPADVYITVKDLKRIDASGQSEVMTSGAFNVTVLQVFLQDGALANVNVNANGIYTIVKDHSRLKLSGKSNEHISVKESGSKLNTTNFACAKTETNESLLAFVDLDAQFAETIDMAKVTFKALK